LSGGDWGKPRRTSVRIADVPAEMRTKYFTNMGSKGYHYANLLRTAARELMGILFYACRQCAVLVVTNY
jgi:hypothetical protein